jgi:hypothetical protein
VTTRRQTPVAGVQRGWRDQGKGARLASFLASIYGWFAEGFETLDLKEAKVDDFRDHPRGAMGKREPQIILF